MRRLALPLTALLAIVVFATGVRAECFADYKARRGNPLELHYGVIRLNDADCGNPAGAIARRIAADGWQLLTVVGTFDQNGANMRKSDAGAYYLRY